MGLKITSAISSPSPYLVLSFSRTSNSIDMKEFGKHNYASSLGKLIEILELLLLIVAKLFGLYFTTLIFRTGLSKPYVSLNGNIEFVFFIKNLRFKKLFQIMENIHTLWCFRNRFKIESCS